MRPLSSRSGRPARAAVLLGGVLLAAGCAGAPTPTDTVVTPTTPPPASAAGPDPATARYCPVVLRVQAEQTASTAAQQGLAAASATARRQVTDLAATAPPEIADDWRTLATLTEQALGSLAATGGDPTRIDRDALARLDQEARPAVDRIQQATSRRCGVSFRPPA